jgi:cell division transport system permease protein
VKQTTVNNLPSLDIPKPNLQVYWLAHWRALLVSLRRLILLPFESITILAVIGIALALPAGLFVVLQNMQQVSQTWGQENKISLFLQINVSQEEAQQLLKRLKFENNIAEAIAEVNYISPEQGMLKLGKQIGFSDGVSRLVENPLPGVIEVIPSPRIHNPEQLSELVLQLRKLPQVDVAQLDMAWVKRLHSLLKLSQKGAYALAVFFACAVFLIIGNTIHLAIQNQRREMEVIKLVGGTYAFIRRPYLYRGMLYGLLGAIFAALLIKIAMFWLGDAVQELAAQYNSSYQLAGLGGAGFMLLLLCGAILGLSGAWLAVSHYLRLAD